MWLEKNILSKQSRLKYKVLHKHCMSNENTTGYVTNTSKSFENNICVISLKGSRRECLRFWPECVMDQTLQSQVPPVKYNSKESSGDKLAVVQLGPVAFAVAFSAEARPTPPWLIQHTSFSTSLRLEWGEGRNQPSSYFLARENIRSGKQLILQEWTFLVCCSGAKMNSFFRFNFNVET